MTTHMKWPLLALSIASGCADPMTGTQGELCTAQHAEYEGTERPLVSPLTQVDTDVHIEPPTTTGCCLYGSRPSEDISLYARSYSEGRTVSQLPPGAAKFPWGGACSTLGQCDTCNSCPYGLQWLQGTWTDFGQASDLGLGYLPLGVETPVFGDESNLLEIDGNTFRWRTVNRLSGHRLDVRGYYYCAQQQIPDEASFGGPAGVVYVPLAIERFEGATCPLRYDTHPGDRSPPIPRPKWPEPGLGIGVPIPLSSAGSNHGPTGWNDHWPYLVEFDGSTDRAYCHPGAYVGTAVPPDGATWSSTRFDCPEASVFFDCW